MARDPEVNTRKALNCSILDLQVAYRLKEEKKEQSLVALFLGSSVCGLRPVLALSGCVLL